MITQEKKRMLYPALSLLAFVLGMLVVFYGGLFPRDMTLQDKDMQTFNTGWRMTHAGETVTLDPLPQNLPADDPIVLENTLPYYPRDSVLLFKVFCRGIKVWAGDRLLYTAGADENHSFVDSMSRSWYLVPLSQHDVGKTLRMELDISRSAHFVQLSNVMLGDKMVTLLSLQRNAASTLIFCCLMMMFAFLLFLSLPLLRKYCAPINRFTFVYLACFMLDTAVWVLTDCGLLQLFTGAFIPLGFLSFFAFMWMPLPLLLFIQDILTRRSWQINALILLFVANFFVQVFLLIGNVWTLPAMLPATHILYALALLTLISLCLHERIHAHNRNMTALLWGMTALCLCGVLALASFYVQATGPYAMIFLLGMGLFVGFLFAGACKYAMEMIDTSARLTELNAATLCGVCKYQNDADLTLLYANDAYYRIFGYADANEAIASGYTTVRHVIAPDAWTAFRAQLTQNVAQGIVRYTAETQGQTKDGAFLWILAQREYDAQRNTFSASILDITNRKAMEDQLRVREEEYRIVVRHSEKLLLRYNVPTRTLYLEAAAAALLGLPGILENVPYSTIEKQHVAPESAQIYVDFYERMIRGEPEGHCTFLFQNDDQDFRWYRSDYTLIYDQALQPLTAIISFEDITDWQEKELIYEKWRQSVENLSQDCVHLMEFSLSRDVLEHEEGTLLVRFGIHAHAGVDAQLQDLLDHVVYVDDRAALQSRILRKNLRATFYAETHTFDMDFRTLDARGNVYWLNLSVQMVQYPGSIDIKVFLLFTDIHLRKTTEMGLTARSRQDALTGALNRATFMAEVCTLLAQSAPNTTHVLMMMDLDHFKQVNDTLGHPRGDQLLSDTVHLLLSALHADDLLGRIGGDEFMIYLHTATTTEDITHCAQAICRAVIQQSPDTIPVTASLGIARFPQNGTTFELLYRHADQALYQAKANGRNGYAFYHPDISQAPFIPNTSPICPAPEQPYTSL